MNIIIIDCNNGFKEEYWAVIFQNSPDLLGCGLTGSALPRHHYTRSFLNVAGSFVYALRF
jgi:hypothetical protein